MTSGRGVAVEGYRYVYHCGVDVEKEGIVPHRDRLDLLEDLRRARRGGEVVTHLEFGRHKKVGLDEGLGGRTG